MWLPDSEYKEAHGYMLWRYDEKTKDLDDPDCILEAYIPTEKKRLTEKRSARKRNPEDSKSFGK